MAAHRLTLFVFDTFHNKRNIIFLLQFGLSLLGVKICEVFSKKMWRKLKGSPWKSLNKGAKLERQSKIHVKLVKTRHNFLCKTSPNRREYLALNVYVALCYYKLDYYDVSQVHNFLLSLIFFTCQYVRHSWKLYLKARWGDDGLCLINNDWYCSPTHNLHWKSKIFRKGEVTMGEGTQITIFLSKEGGGRIYNVTTYLNQGDISWNTQLFVKHELNLTP